MTHPGIRISARERGELIRRLSEVPIAEVRRESVARGRPRSFNTLAKLAAIGEDGQ